MKEDVFAKSLDMHRELRGKLDIGCRKKIESMATFPSCTRLE